MQMINYQIYVDLSYYALRKIRKSFLKKVVIPGALTHFQKMFDLCRNELVGFYYQNVWKAPVEEWHFK